MKKLISILLVCVLAFSVTACTNADKDNQESQASQENTVTETQTQSASQEQSTQPSIDTKNISVTVPVMKTKDWNTYNSAEYNGKSEMTVSLDIPKDYTSDATVIYNTDNIKFGEIVGVVPYDDGQTAFDTVELNKNYNDIVYTDKDEGTVNGTKKCSVLLGTAPTADGEWYIYSYAVDFEDYAVVINLYSVTELEDITSEHIAVLSNVKAD